MIFLALLGKIMFLFPENMVLFFRRKMKDDLSQKNTWKYYIFCECSEKIVFPEISHWNMVFLVLSKKDDVFFSKNMILSFRLKMKHNLSQNSTWKYDTFCKCSEKMVFQKNSHMNMIFLQLSGKMISLFPGNKISFFISLL